MLPNLGDAKAKVLRRARINDSGMVRSTREVQRAKAAISRADRVQDAIDEDTREVRASRAARKQNLDRKALNKEFEKDYEPTMSEKAAAAAQLELLKKLDEDHRARKGDTEEQLAMLRQLNEKTAPKMTVRVVRPGTKAELIKALKDGGFDRIMEEDVPQEWVGAPFNRIDNAVLMRSFNRPALERFWDEMKG